jgi:hypothetical protein
VTRYIVVLPNGERYGPATSEMLVQWAAEGRVLPTTVVEDAQTGRATTAASIPGLVFAGAHPAVHAPPSGRQATGIGGPASLPPLPLSLKQPGDDEATGATWLAGGSLLCLCCGLGLVPSALALVLALVSLQKGSSRGRTALWVSVIALAVHLLAFFASRSMSLF